MKVGTVVLSLVGMAVLSVAIVQAEGDAGAVKKARDGAKPDMFAALDADGNGSISLAEFKVMHDKKTEKMKAADPEGKKPIPTAEEAFAKFDADKDGSLTKDELMAGHGKGKGKGEGRGKGKDKPAEAPAK